MCTNTSFIIHISSQNNTSHISNKVLQKYDIKDGIIMPGYVQTYYRNNDNIQISTGEKFTCVIVDCESWPSKMEPWRSESQLMTLGHCEYNSTRSCWYSILSLWNKIFHYNKNNFKNILQNFSLKQKYLLLDHC